MEAVSRRCALCPAWTRTVCRHAFGRFWGDKSRGGEGCAFPLDGVAEAWRRAGWTPGDGVTGEISLPLPAAPAARPTASKTQFRMPAMPRRPGVSAATVRQAELFFGRRR